MPLPHFEVLTGAIDGSNVDYFTSMPFRPGSFAGFTNGQLTKKNNVDGWVEVDPYAGHVRWNQAPLVGDVVQGFFVDLVIVPGEIVCNLSGKMRRVPAPMGKTTLIPGMTAKTRKLPVITGKVHVC